MLDSPLTMEEVTDPGLIARAQAQFEPTHCAGCGTVIKMGEGGYSVSGGKYTCMECCSPELRGLFSRS